MDYERTLPNGKKVLITGLKKVGVAREKRSEYLQKVISESPHPKEHMKKMREYDDKIKGEKKKQLKAKLLKMRLAATRKYKDTRTRAQKLRDDDIAEYRHQQRIDKNKTKLTKSQLNDTKDDIAERTNDSKTASKKEKKVDKKLKKKTSIPDEIMQEASDAAGLNKNQSPSYIAQDHKHSIVFKGHRLGGFRGASLNSQSGKFAKYWLLNAKETNGNGWGIAAHTASQNMKKFIGRPLVVTAKSWHGASEYGEQFEHPYLPTNDINAILKHQDKFRVGSIVDVFEDKNGDWFANVEMLPKFANKILPPFCSPAIYQLDAKESEGQISKWEALHLAALTENPAYGARIALLKGTCIGTGSECKVQFKAAKLEGKVICTKKLKGRIANIFDEQEMNEDKGSEAYFTKRRKPNPNLNRMRKQLGLEPVKTKLSNLKKKQRIAYKVWGTDEAPRDDPRDKDICLDCGEFNESHYKDEDSDKLRGHSFNPPGGPQDKTERKIRKEKNPSNKITNKDLKRRVGKLKQKIAVRFESSFGPDFDALDAFKAKRKYKSKKFESTGDTLKLRGHTVARHHKEGIEVSNAGHDTPLTYSTIKGLGIHARNQKGVTKLNNKEIDVNSGEWVLAKHKDISGNPIKYTNTPGKRTRSVTEQSKFRQQVEQNESNVQGRKGKLPLSQINIQPNDQKRINKITGVKSPVGKEILGVDAHHILSYKKNPGLRRNPNNGIMIPKKEHKQLTSFAKLKARLKLATLGEQNMTYQESKKVKIHKRKHPEVRKAGIEYSLRKVGRSIDGSHDQSTFLAKDGDFIGGNGVHIAQAKTEDLDTFQQRTGLIRVQNFPINRAGDKVFSFGINSKVSSKQLRAIKDLEAEGKVIGFAVGPSKTASVGKGYRDLTKALREHKFL